MKVSVIIPARMAASRFPGKPLALINGLPMIEHVRRRALLNQTVSEAIVATCDKEILECVTQHGGDCVMTSKDHERCTDRVAEAAEKIKSDIVVIIQGDEPLVNPSCVKLCLDPFHKNPSVKVVSMLSPLEKQSDLTDSKIVKAYCNSTNEIMSFTRISSLYYRKLEQTPIFRETGIRALKHDFLLEYFELPQSPFERVESIDMYRVLENGHSIQGVIFSKPTYGVDYIEDVDLIENILNNSIEEKNILKKITE